MHKHDLRMPHSARMKKWGHRRYTGGGDPQSWYDIGKRQYHFLISQGLLPTHKFLDVACGGLRLGQFVIPALDVGNYYGLEAEQALVEAGLRDEFLFDITTLKKPNFTFNYHFDLTFCPGYDFAIAQSLFTHLTPEDITKCFTAMHPIAQPNSKFFFTFHEGNKARNRYQVSHANRKWRYSFDDIEAIANATGFDCCNIGDWGHERKQMIAVASPKV